MVRRRRFLAVLLAGVLPWVAVTWPGGWYPIFAVGFAHLDPPSFTTLPAWVDRVGTVPSRFSAWPVATVLYGAGLAAAAIDDADGVVVAGLLALSAANVALLAMSLSGQRGVLAVPVGALWLVAAAGYAVYRDARAGDLFR
ncbi:MAG: TIGR04206 family protein [Halobacterium sp.]